MAYELAAAIKGTKEGIGLVSAVVGIARELQRREDDPALQTLLDELKVTARDAIRTLEFAINDVRDMLARQNLPFDKSLRDLLANTSFCGWFERRRLSKVIKTARHVEDVIHTLMGDVSALLICSGQMEGAGEAYASGYQRGEEILANSPLAMPIGKLLERFGEQLAELEIQAGRL